MEARPGLEKRDGLFIGIGNDLRTDDSVGPYVARRMKPAALPGTPAGTAMEFDATRESLPVDRFGVSTRAFGLPRAIELCRVPGRLPGRIVVMGIQGRNVEPGCGLCPDIRKTADALVDRLSTELRTGLEPGPQRGKDGAQGVGGCHSERST